MAILKESFYSTPEEPFQGFCSHFHSYFSAAYFVPHAKSITPMAVL